MDCLWKALSFFPKPAILRKVTGKALNFSGKVPQSILESELSTTIGSYCIGANCNFLCLENCFDPGSIFSVHRVVVGK